MMFLSLAAEAATGEAGGTAFPPFDPWHFPSQLFWLVIMFGVLYIALSRFVLPKLGGVIEKRGDTIADSLDEAARLDEQAKEAKRQQEQANASGTKQKQAKASQIKRSQAKSSKRKPKHAEASETKC